MKMIMGILFFSLMVLGTAFAMPTPPDACQTDILLTGIISICVLAIIIGILFKTASLIIHFEVSNSAIIMLVGIAIIIMITFAFLVGGMSPCVVPPS